MNRQIKFRFWGKFGELNEEKDECENEMLYGDRFCFSDHAPINDLFADKSFVAMQFTGLVDKNGKEVYEADIVIHDSEKIVVSYAIQSVDAFEGAGFNLWSFYGEKLGGFRLQSEIEIIGNVFENPELLKTNKDEK
jgi:hypothetical protein